MTNDKKVFNDEIRPAFEKLIESLIFVYGFYNLGDVETLKRECMTYLFETLTKFDATKGTKGFSYFNVVARNWFIQKSRDCAKRNKRSNDLVDFESLSTDPEFTVNPHESAVEELEQWKNFRKNMSCWSSKLTKKIDRDVLSAVDTIFSNSDMITIFNKKAIYLYLRELTGFNTKQIVASLKSLKIFYDEWKRKYQEDGR